MKPRRRSVLALIASAAAIAAALPLYALAAIDVSKAPDLRADPVEAIEGPAVYSDTEGGTGANRLLVRFDGFVTNVGNGPLEIRGNPQKAQSDPAGVKQYAWSTTQGVGDVPAQVVGTPEVAFEANDSHNHFHLKQAMRYSLWNLSKTAQVAPGQKVGFCLYDLEKAPSPSPAQDPQVYTEPVTLFCDAGNAGATALRMGVSSGWRDVYDKSLAYQWVDVSSTSPGTYLVASEADPGNAIWEGGGAAETNTRAFATPQVTVPGYVAKPVTLAQTGGPQDITLTSTAFGSPGAVRFTIVKGPDHGTLDQATAGPGFAGPTVTYTPQAGYTGADAFSYIAYDSTSSFPLAGSDPQAAVSLVAAAPAVAISGAPASLIAGTSAQLSAAVSNTPGGVTWSTTAGTISAGGLLVAPSAPPAGGTLTVRATSVSAPTVNAQAVIAVTPVPEAEPAPLPPPTAPATPPVIATSAKLLSRLTVAHIGRRIVVGTITTGPKAGRVDVIVSFKGMVLGRCGARVGAHKTVSCKITLKGDYPLASVQMTAKLSILGTSTAVRRAFVSVRPARG